MIKSVIFDMDGLMFNTEAMWVKYGSLAGNKYGYPVSQDFIKTTIGSSKKIIEEKFLQEYGSNFPFNEVYDLSRKMMLDEVKKNSIEVKKGLHELIDYLVDNNYKLAIASSSDYERILLYLKSAKIDENIFTAIVSGHDFKNGKPSPDIYIKTCELINTYPQEALVLEDSNQGIISAKNANCVTCFIKDLVELTTDTKSLIDYQAHDLNEVKDILELVNRK